MKKILLVLLLSISAYGKGVTDICLVAVKNYDLKTDEFISHVQARDTVAILEDVSELNTIYLDVIRFCTGDRNSAANAAIVEQHQKVIDIKNALF